MNGVHNFAKRVAGLPGGRLFIAVSASAILFTTIAGAFGTGDLPILRRLTFWSMLIAFNTLAWMCWFAWRVRGPSDWWRAAALGLPIINLPLPLEVGIASAAVSGEPATDWPRIWLYSAALSLALLLVIAIALPQRPKREGREFAKGALWRAGARMPEDVFAIGAEDHYCRVYLADGSNRLVHSRFSDLVEELMDADGAVVRRGQWVAARAVQSVERADRRWILRLDGRVIPVAPSCVKALRARGWI